VSETISQDSLKQLLDKMVEVVRKIVAEKNPDLRAEIV